MPIYQYRCASCGHDFEKMQKLAEAPLTDCPECAAPTLKKVISAVGFRLKGGGWYETDFKTGDKKKNLHETGDQSSAESKDSKPALANAEGAKTETSKSETAKPKESAPKPAESKPAPKSDAA